jgi:hypothetical protein
MEIKFALKLEGYAGDQIQGPELFRQLRELIAIAQAPSGHRLKTQKPQQAC